MNSESNAKSPLAGLTVMVTRPHRQAHLLADSLRRQGADVLIEPVIEILPPLDWAELDRAIQQTAEGRVSSLVFVSVNGVRAFFDRIAQLSETTKSSGTSKLADLRVLGIGRATCEALADRGIKAQAVPGKAESNSVADFLIGHPLDGGTLIVRADRGSDVLAERLNAAEINFEQVVAYRSADRASVPAASIRAMEAGDINWVTVTSSAIAGSLVQLFGEALNETKLVSISPTTSAALKDRGHSPSAEATDYNMPGIVAAIIAAGDIA